VDLDILSVKLCNYY